jgi:hypothetical protein
MSNTSNIMSELSKDHIKFLTLIADIVGHTISNQGWIRAKSYLSPAEKFRITDPIMMAPELFAKATILPFNHIIYKEREKIRIYVKYDFLTSENAACNEFLLRGAPFDKPQSIDLPGVTHAVSRSVDDPNKIIGILSISGIENSSIYNQLLAILPKK